MFKVLTNKSGTETEYENKSQIRPIIRFDKLKNIIGLTNLLRNLTN